MSKDRYRYFRIEAREHLQKLLDCALALEREDDPSVPLKEMLRRAHTLKGAARVVQLGEVAEATHALEGLLEPHRGSSSRVPRETVDQLLGMIDGLQGQVDLLDPATEVTPGTKATTTAPRSVKPAAGTIRDTTLRVEISEVDRLIEALHETEQITGLFEEPLHRLQTCASDLERASVGSDEASLRQLSRRVAGTGRMLSDALVALRRSQRRNIDLASRLRLAPAMPIINHLERLARETAKALGLTVRFTSEGGLVSMDGAVLEGLQEAMVHVVSNAVVHGLGRDTDRVRHGKPLEGHLHFHLTRRGDRVVASCRDDGRGLDLDALRLQATSQGWIPEGREVSQDELVEILLRGGISTATETSTLAGRGLGLEVVHETVRRLRGEVALTTQPGQGTTVVISLPASRYALRVLVTQVTGRRVLFPAEAVPRTRMVQPGDIQVDAGRSRVQDRGDWVAYGSLPTLLGLTEADVSSRGAARGRPAVLVQRGPRRVMVAVDRLEGVFDRVIHPLPASTPSISLVPGAAVSARGECEPLLDADALVHAVLGQPRFEPPARSRLTVLVIDDSLTTRALEKSILEAAGFKVDTASSGEAGLELARRNRYAVAVVDVEMPGIDGFEVVGRLKRDPEFGGLPAILVTSRASPEDVERGRVAGARGHIQKSKFDEGKLLELIGGILEGT